MLVVSACCLLRQPRACLSERGCPKPPPLADCASADPVRDLEDVLASGGTLLGEVVSVRGPLQRGFNICTMRGGPEGTCPNSCVAAVGLVAPHPCERDVDAGLYVCWYDDAAHTLRLPSLGCRASVAPETIRRRAAPTRPRDRSWSRAAGSRGRLRPVASTIWPAP
jgi:hypothetical protein